MKDYSKLTNEELFNELDKLHMSLEQDEAMDGSGELGGRIYKGYEPFFNAVYAEMDRRGLSENDYSEDSNGSKKFEATADGDLIIYTAGDILSSGMFDNEDLQEIMNLKVGEVFKIDMCGDYLKRIK